MIGLIDNDYISIETADVGKKGTTISQVHFCETKKKAATFFGLVLFLKSFFNRFFNQFFFSPLL